MITIFVLFSIPSVIAAYSEEDVDLLFEKGLESYQNEKHDEALSYFEKVLEIEPNHLGALTNKGVLLNTLGKHDEALSYFDKVLEIEPNHVDALVNKGSTLGSLDQYDDALFYLDMALEIKPNDVGALSNKAAVFVDQENFDEALYYFDKVLEIEPNHVAALVNKGSILFSLGQFDDALFYLDEALEIEPNDVGALSYKGAIFVKEGNFDEAITYFYEVLKIDPDNEIAKVYIPIAKKAVGFLPVKGFKEFIIRNEQGTVITYFKSPYIGILDHDLGRAMVDLWPVAQVVSVNGTDYEVHQRMYNRSYEEVETVFAATVVYFSGTPSLRLVFTPNWGFPLTDGDSVNLIYTVYKPIE